MARIWQCGFELNTLTTGVEISATSGTISVQSTIARTGTYALRTNAGTSFVRQHLAGSNQSTQVWVRACIYIATLPGATTAVLRIANGSNATCAQIGLTTSGTLVLNDATGTLVGSASAALSTATWYTIELFLDASSSPGTVTGRLDGTQFATGANSSQASWARALVGIIGSTTGDLYWDDWAVNDSTGSGQTSWPGIGKIIHLIPNGDGDNHAWNNTGNTAGSSTNYQLVDEIPPNDSTDFVQIGTANAEDMYALTDSGIGASDVVNVVMVGFRGRNNSADATAAAKLQIKKTSGGTITQGTAIVPNTTTFFTNANAEPRNYTLVTYTDPDGAAWTQATLDTAQAGIKLTTANTQRVQASAIWVSVDYTVSSTTPISSSDTGAGADAGSVSAAVSDTETGVGVDATTIAAATSSADTAAGAESASISIPSADTGSDTESAVITATTSSADTGSGADTTSLSAAVSSDDPGAGADVATVSATTTAPDTATGADTGAVVASTSSGDLSSGLDAGSVGAAVAAAETASGAESTSLVVMTTESASAVDDTGISAVTSSSDTAAGVDSASVVANVPGNDQASGVDAGSVSASLTAGDTASGADAQTVDQGTLPVSATDTALGVDSAFVTASIASSDLGSLLDDISTRAFGTADSGAGSDSAAVQAALSSGDLASSAETQSLVAGIAASETGSAADVVSASSAALSTADTATGVDSMDVQGSDSRFISEDDAAVATDANSLLAATSSADLAGSIDVAALFVSLTASDTAVGVEGSPQVGLTGTDTASTAEGAALSVSLSATDTGSGTDVTTALFASIVETDTGAGEDASPVSSVSQSAADTATGLDLLVILNTLADADVAVSLLQTASIVASIFPQETVTGMDAASVEGPGRIEIEDSDTVSAFDQADLILGVFSFDTVLSFENIDFIVDHDTGDVTVGVESTSTLVSLTASDIVHVRDSAGIFVRPTRSHRVKPYYIREPQNWAIEQERRRHNEALWYIGENTMFALMWHLEDFQDNLVGRCPTCYESQGQIAQVYGQSDEYKCPDCFGTTFEGGFKALIVRPAIFSDSDEGETKSGRGIVHPQDLTIESTPDFRIRTGDYCFRVTGDRYYMRVPERITLRTGFGHATQTETAIGYNHANAAVEDPDSVAYMIPPANDEVSQILNRASRIPRDWSTFEVVRAPLIPSSDLIGGS